MTLELKVLCVFVCLESQTYTEASDSITPPFLDFFLQSLLMQLEAWTPYTSKGAKERALTSACQSLFESWDAAAGDGPIG